jgi:hypothetical protein
MPQQSSIIATKSPNGTVYVFDSASPKHSATPSDNVCHPEARLSGHTEEGYGLSWSAHDQGMLLSGADDERVCLWDIGAAPGADGTVPPLRTFVGHAGTVEVRAPARGGAVRGGAVVVGGLWVCVHTPVGVGGSGSGGEAWGEESGHGLPDLGPQVAVASFSIPHSPSPSPIPYSPPPLLL